jgi:starch synthase
MEKTKVLYISQEITPYLPETEMSKIGRYLPQGIQEKGKEIRAFMPKYGIVNERRNQLHEVIRLSGMNIIIDDTDHSLIIKVASIQSARMQVYFIDNDDYFQRRSLFSDPEKGFYPDNDERAIFFTRGVIETVKKLRWSPDLIHCHGWITSLIPLYIKKAFHDDPLFHDSKVIYSIYDDEFSGQLDQGYRKKIKLRGINIDDTKNVETPDYVSINK